MTHPKANATSFKPGNKSGGRPVKTDDERAAYQYLVERTPAAARRLVELEQSGDEKIALGATLGHLKIVVGELSREADKSGDPISATWTYEQYMAALAQVMAAKK